MVVCMMSETIDVQAIRAALGSRAREYAVLAGGTGVEVAPQESASHLVAEALHEARLRLERAGLDACATGGRLLVSERRVAPATPPWLTNPDDFGEDDEACEVCGSPSARFCECEDLDPLATLPGMRAEHAAQARADEQIAMGWAS